jgi:hypothetical protein
MNYISKWVLRLCLVVSGFIVIGGTGAKDANAALWYNVMNGVPFPMEDAATRACFSLPDGMVQQNCAGSKFWDYVLPHNGCSSNPNTSSCTTTFHSVSSYAIASSPGGGGTTNSRLYAYDSGGVFFGATNFCNHTGSNAVCLHTLSVPMGDSLLMEWSVPQNGRIGIVSYN